MLVLHGCVQPINNYLSANLEEAAEAHGMVIAVPDAMNKAGGIAAGLLARWSGDYKNLIKANALSGDVARNIDPKQVYIAGLSSGAAMAAQKHVWHLMYFCTQCGSYYWYQFKWRYFDL